MTAGRFFQILNALVFGALVVGGVMSACRGSSGGFALIAFGLVAGSITVTLFELQIRSARKKAERVLRAVEAIARTLFDEPAPVHPGYNLAATMPAAIAAMVIDFGKGFTTDGTFRNVRVSAASHVSTAGRQIGELSHIYSYVLVDVLGASVPFGLLEKGAGSRFATSIGVTRDSPIGDAAFDSAFTIDMDPELARDVFAPASIRARLIELRSKVWTVSVDVAQGRMSFILTQYGLAVRWPGELDPAFAQWMRDLLIDIRAGILAHLDRMAARTSLGDGYRAATGGGP